MAVPGAAPPRLGTLLMGLALTHVRGAGAAAWVADSTQAARGYYERVWSAEHAPLV